MTKQPLKKTTTKKRTPAATPVKSAVDDAMTEAFINEVSEEVKNDNMKAFFKIILCSPGTLRKYSIISVSLNSVQLCRITTIQAL